MRKSCFPAFFPSARSEGPRPVGLMKSAHGITACALRRRAAARRTGGAPRPSRPQVDRRPDACPGTRRPTPSGPPPDLLPFTPAERLRARSRQHASPFPGFMGQRCGVPCVEASVGRTARPGWGGAGGRLVARPRTKAEPIGAGAEPAVWSCIVDPGKPCRGFVSPGPDIACPRLDRRIEEAAYPRGCRVAGLDYRQLR